MHLNKTRSKGIFQNLFIPVTPTLSNKNSLPPWEKKNKASVINPSSLRVEKSHALHKLHFNNFKEDFFFFDSFFSDGHWLSQLHKYEWQPETTLVGASLHKE